MKITANMHLNDLAERMGSEATTEDAAAMRTLLVEQHDGQDTQDVPATKWDALLARI